MYRWLMMLLLMCITLALFAVQTIDKGGLFNQKAVYSIDVFAVGVMSIQPIDNVEVVRYQMDSVKGLVINIMEELSQELLLIHKANSIYYSSGIGKKLKNTNHIRADMMRSLRPVMRYHIDTSRMTITNHIRYL